MKTSWKVELPQWALIAGMFLLAAVTWSSAPERIPLHWDLYGRPDGYGGKAEGLLAIPLLALGVYLLLVLLPRVDPGRANYASFAGAYAILRLSIIAVLAAVYSIIHTWIRGVALAVETLVPFLVGALFVVMGSLMGKVRPNWFVGVRTPWTLSSKRSWVKTHRMAGWLFVAIGLAVLGAALAGRPLVTLVVLAGLLATAIAWLLAYSYLVWRNDPEAHPPAGTRPA